MSEDQTADVSAPVAPPRFEGDDGTTTLGQVGKVNNDDIRLAAFQDCGEVNSAVGVVLALAGGLDSQDIAMLSSIQHDLYDLTSDIGSANPRGDSDVPHITDAHIERLERACEHYRSELVTSYDDAVLPGGTAGAALLYQARSITQRAERTAWTASVKHPDTLSPLPHRYLNRLALLLGILAHDANAEHGDTRWNPMASCAPVESTNGTEPQ
ncbi:ATP:cob(I)alamin adenosyltransferase [Nocardioidaceae bacterium SCSIO 66511]|nr:ATP:cob(I)alamin adenosyltransferase [Nocardioidaceae bacterium SCSIO 66511]